MKSANILRAAGLATLIAAGGFQTVAHAQTADATEKRFTTTNSNAQSGLPEGVNLSAGNDSSVISVSGHHVWEDGGGGIGTQSLSVKASIPLNKADSAAAFLTDGNLLNGFSLEFSYSRTRLGRLPTPDVAMDKAYYLAAQKKCLAVTAPELTDKACGYASERGEDPAFSARSLQKFLDPKTVADVAFYYEPLWRWGVTGSVGYHNFDFRDATTFSQQSEGREDVAASLFFSRQGWTVFGASADKRAQLTLAGGAEYKNSYAAAKSKTLCRTAPATGAQECFTGAFGIPDRTETGDAFVDLKWDPPSDPSSTLGLKGAEFKSTYDFEGAGASVGAAVYLFGDGKGGRTGGIKVSYLSDHQTPVKGRNFMIGVFTGLPFP